ncbi:MAG: AraC family transcriptional regulator [Cyclobacteriaceae bacterium]
MKSQNSTYQLNLNNAITYIENNLDKKILLKDIANEAHLSEFHFHRIFKAIGWRNG